MGAIGGNIHNELVDSDAQVELFKAVETRNHTVCHNGCFVAYKVDEEDEEVIHSDNKHATTSRTFSVGEIWSVNIMLQSYSNNSVLLLSGKI